MSFALLAALAAGVAASLGYMSARRGRALGDDEGGADEKPLGQPRRNDPSAGFKDLPFGLGDVVMAGSEERWLSGAIVAREKGEIVAVVFLAPEGSRQAAVVAFPPPRREIYWLMSAAVDSPQEPPATLEIDAVSMRRRARVPATLDRLGQGVPPLGGTGLVATYEAFGSEVALVITSNGRACAWSGRRIEEDAYERLGGGGTGE